MTRPLTPIVLVAAGALTTCTLAACGGGSGATDGSSGSTLYYQSNTARETMDPQRTYTAEGVALADRLYSRSLVSFPISDNSHEAAKPVPDLATTTGTSSHDAKTWKFTLRQNVKWQDGSPVTCADVKYGTARTFATDVITGGPTYMLGYLNIPDDPRTGLPKYDGPYKKDGQSYFDKAVTCNGRTITYHFKKPWPDFPLYLAALGAGDPYKQSRDKGSKSQYAIFSDGPYTLQGSWVKGKGGTFVRNPEWNAKTDPIRKALPAKIVFQEGVTPEIGAQRMIADGGTDRDAVTINNIPPSAFSQITGRTAQRTVNPQAAFVEYLTPNFLRLKSPQVRQALAVALDKAAYIDAGGGSKLYSPAYSLVNPSVPGYQKNPSFASIPSKGNPVAAKKLLQQANVKMPYPITLTYRSNGPTSAKQFAAIAASWNDAGFKVTLRPLTDTYWTALSTPNATWDVAWANWAPAWPSMSTELPPLLDNRTNLTKASTGQDYGSYKSDAVNRLFDQAAASPSISQQTALYQKAEIQLGRDTAYIPLAIQKFYRLHGSDVTGSVAGAATNRYPDLAGIDVSK